MNILLTGGAGYIGSACLRWLLRHGHDAVAFDDLSEGNAAAVPPGRLVVGSILDPAALAEAICEHAIEAIMHFAAVASVPESIQKPELYWRVNVQGTKNVLDVAHRAEINRILFSSTAATYSFRSQMPLDEDSPQSPKVPYGTTKLAAEWLLREYGRAYGMGYTILRYFNASGADPDGQFGEDRRHESHLIPLVLMTALGKREIVDIFGSDWDTPDGTCVRDFVHTDDLASAHQLAMETLDPGQGRVYTCGSGTGSTVLEVVKACERVVGRPIPHRIVDRRSGDPAVLIASPRRLVEELGWQPRFKDIDEVIDTAWRWHHVYPDGYASKVAISEDTSCSRFD